MKFPSPPKSKAPTLLGKIDISSQKRGVYFMAIWFCGTLLVGLLAEFIPPFFGQQPLSFLWMGPVIFASLIVVFATSQRTTALSGPLGSTAQWIVAIASLGAILGILFLLGSKPVDMSEFRRVIIKSSDDRSLMITAFIIAAMLGWMARIDMPIRSMSYAMLTIFIAVWMDFQGYYTVIVDGQAYSSIGLGYDTALNERLEDVQTNDNGRAFAKMTMGTIAVWIPLVGWSIYKRRRAAGNAA